MKNGIWTIWPICNVSRRNILTQAALVIGISSASLAPYQSFGNETQAQASSASATSEAKSHQELPATSFTGWLGGTAPNATSKIPDRREFQINPAINPCQDFYQYVCSKPVAEFKLRDDRSRHIFAFNDSSERLLEKKKAYFSGLNQEKKFGRFGQILKTVYLACMNEDASRTEEKETVKAWTQKVAAFTDRQKFLEFLGENIDSADASFMDFGSLPNLDNPDELDLVVVSKLQSLPERSYYDNAALVKEWTELFTSFFETIGLDQPADRAKSVVEFEKSFSKTYPLPAEFRELMSTRTQISREELLKKYPNFKLNKLLAKIPAKTLIRHITPANFDWLNQAVATQPLETLKNIFLLHQLKPYLDDAYPEFFKKAFAFNNKFLGGPQQRPDRQERCTTQMMGSFDRELDFELLPRIFPNFPTKKFISLAENIRRSIIQGLQKNDWLSPQGKLKAIEKIKKAKLHLIKPTRDEDWDFNPKLTYSPVQPYENMKKLKKALNSKELHEFSVPRNKNRWSMGPLTVNAYYSASDNKFVMPIGILQYPFYDPALPEYINLGAVGAVIGHELGHGIDDQGSKYDETGKFNQWLGEKDLDGFKKRSHQLVEDFSSMGINGQLTLGENIGDLVGVTFAYQAAFPQSSKASLDKKKDFFVQYARNWCGVALPKALERLIKVDPHSPFYARVNGQVKYQPGFAEAFSCKAGDPMFLPSEKRIKIW